MSHIQYSFDQTLLSPPQKEGYVTSQENQLLYISSAIFGRDWISTYHSHSFMELFFVVDGSGHFCTEYKEIPIQKGSLVLVNPNIRHTEKSTPQSKLTYIVLGINNLHWDLGDSQPSDYYITSLTEHFNDLFLLMRMMLTEAREQQNYSDTICQYFLSILLLKITRLTENHFVSLSSKNISNDCTYIKNYIDSHYDQGLTLDHLASLVHLNKYYLSHLFTDTFGISPISYLLEKRILKSKEFLRLTDFSVTHIATIVGFSSGNYFSQTFKKYTGLTPVLYRKKWINNPLNKGVNLSLSSEE